MSFGKQEAKQALSKELKDISDSELTELLTIPETFLPITDKGHTVNSLAAEKVRREAASRPSDEEVIQAAIDAITLQQIINLGVGLYPLIDKVSRYHLREELKRREKVFNDLHGRWGAK
jgi:hypothetical protein